MSVPSFKVVLPAGVSGRQPVLDELKGLAIALMVLYHAGGVLGWENRLHGDIGVDMFVVLSGVGLALGSGVVSAKNFLTRRLLRIMPGYWIALTLFLVCNGYFLQLHYPTGDIIVHYAGIHAWLGEGHALSINDSFWFISLILPLYVLYCVVHSLPTARLLLIGALVSAAVALFYFYTNQPGTFAHLGLRMPDFFIGVALGRLLKEGRLEFDAGADLGCALLPVAYVPYTQGIIFAPLAAGLAMMGFYAFALRPWLANVAPPVPRMLTFLGDHSLEIFLLHQPLIREYAIYCLGRFGGITQPGPLHLLFGMAIGLTLTLFLSVELKHLLQKIPSP